MKILHIITRLNTGGPAVFLDYLTQSMSDLNCENIIVFGYCGSNESDYTKNHKYKAKLIKVNSLHRSLNPVDDIRSFFSLRKIIKQNNPQVINTHTSKAGVLGRLAARSVRKNMPVVHTFHGHLIYGYFARFKSFVFTIIEKFMAKFTNCAVAVTGETKSSLTALGIGKKLNWQVIPIGITPKDNQIKSISAGDKIKLLWVGRFTDIKDPFYAVEVLKLLNARSLNMFELTMVGEGELFEQTKAAAKALPITFTGWIVNPFESGIDFDLLLITSKNEGLPLVMLEAANNHRVTMSRNVGGVGEFIKNNETGYLISGGAKEMADKLIQISENKKVLEELGITANKLLKQRFSADNMARSYLSLYSSLTISK
jgi:glycosyltransferase involved in cell wall biosynthesis